MGLKEVEVKMTIGKSQMLGCLRMDVVTIALMTSSITALQAKGREALHQSHDSTYLALNLDDWKRGICNDPSSQAACQEVSVTALADA